MAKTPDNRTVTWSLGADEVKRFMQLAAQHGIQLTGRSRGFPKENRVLIDIRRPRSRVKYDDFAYSVRPAGRSDA